MVEKEKKSWMEREAEKADREEGGRKAKSVRCSKCGKEVEEYLEIGGRVLCVECYASEEANETGAMGMPGEGGGAG
ncbi:MAG: hypothetical protein ACXQTW_05395 [Candidatus Methanospirareceae archaeon]